MTFREIEAYLAKKNIQIDKKVGEEIENLRQKAIVQQNEEQANYCWCLLQIYKIQKGFISAINDLKNHKYEESWRGLDSVDIELAFLGDNFDLEQGNDKYHLMFIGRILKEYQKLFPYRHFLSRESVIKAEECSICGKPISLRHPCGHRVGKLYMGELCTRKVVDMEFKAFCIVTDPFDKYSYLKIEGCEYDYGILETLMDEIENPYTDFVIETIKMQKPEYRDVGRNDSCPCGSGKKYKKCHLGTQSELMDHHKIWLSKPALSNKGKNVKTFSTWK